MTKKLETVIDEWIKATLSDYSPIRHTKRKIIKDPIWNIIELHPLECAIMDTPLIQRLRRIHQTGLTYFTYPAAVHTRFEHTLGVVEVVSKIASKLSFTDKLSGYSIKPKDLEEMRLAALLHDVGHCALSHLSELHIANHRLFIQYQEKFNKLTGLKPKPHELMGYCIVKTPSFESLFGNLVSDHAGTHEISDPKKTLTRIADMIVGYPPEDIKEQLYLSNIINGAFDADKIDYIARDSYFTGIALGAEVEMLIHKLLVHPTTIYDGVSCKDVYANCIVVNYAGGVAYEQIAMSKKSLNVNVYNHQKVMAAHEMARDLIHEIIKGEMDINGEKYNDPSLFLKVTDWDMLSGSTKSKHGKVLQKGIFRRIIPRRALKIATHTIEDKSVPGLRNFYQKINTDLRHGKTDFREAVAQIAGLETDNVYIAVPKIPNTRELLEGKCIFPDGEIDDIGKHFAGSVESYGLRREISYVYALNCSAKKVAEASKEVLSSKDFGSLSFKPNATAGLE